MTEFEKLARAQRWLKYALTALVLIGIPNVACAAFVRISRACGYAPYRATIWLVWIGLVLLAAPFAWFVAKDD